MPLPDYQVGDVGGQVGFSGSPFTDVMGEALRNVTDRGRIVRSLREGKRKSGAHALDGLSKSF